MVVEVKSLEEFIAYFNDESASATPITAHEEEGREDSHDWGVCTSDNPLVAAVLARRQSLPSDIVQLALWEFARECAEGHFDWANHPEHIGVAIDRIDGQVVYATGEYRGSEFHFKFELPDVESS